MLSSEFIIPESTAYIQYVPKIVLLTNGNFLVSYNDGSGYNTDGDLKDTSSGFSRFVRIFDRDGNPLAADVMVHDNDQNASNLFDYPIFATSNGGFMVLRDEGSTLSIRSYDASGALIGETTSNPLSGLPAGSELVGYTAGDVPGTVLMHTAYSQPGANWWDPDVHFQELRVLDASGQQSGAVIEFGADFFSGRWQVKVLDSVIYAIRGLDSENFEIRAIDLATGTQTASTVLDVSSLYPEGDARVRAGLEISHVTEDGRLILTTADDESVYTGSAWETLGEGAFGIALNAKTLAFDAFNRFAEVDPPDIYSPNAAMLIQLPFGQVFSVFADYDQFEGRIWNADGSAASAVFDLSLRNDRWHVHIDAAPLDDGRVVVTWDYGAPNAGYLDPVMRFLQHDYTGDDMLRGSSGKDIMEGRLGDDSLDGAGGGDTLHGNGGNDQLIGNGGSDKLYGGGNRDILRGDAGNDLLDGGKGNDSALFEGGTDTTVNLGTTKAQNTGHGNDTLRDIENIISGGGNDKLVGDRANNELRGNSGNDELVGKGGSDRLFGGSNKDILLGDAGNDLLDGGGGNDTALFNGGTNTTVNLGKTTAQNTGHGNDKLRAIENVTSGGGDDKLTGNRADNELRSNGGKDELIGSGGNDRLFGGGGNDTLKGGGGNDTLMGNGGNDILTGNRNADDFVFSGRFGDDVIRDFNANSGREDIDLSGVKAIKGFRDLSRNHMEQDGDDVVIAAGKNSITILDVDMSDLGKNDFLF